MSKEWQLHSWYRGCPIEYRPGMQRRGFLSVYHNYYGAGDIGTFVHHSEATAKRHIDKLHKDLGDQVMLSEAEYQQWLIDVS